MAKKKASSSKPLEKQLVMDASEKLDHLKSLNQMLLKETTERRQQVESLLQAKGCLESEITRSNSEKEALSESAVSLELEKSVVSAFIAVQLDQVRKENEEIEVKRNVEMVKRLELEKLVSGLSETVTILQKESEKLRLNLSELENESAKSRERRKEMENEIDGLVAEKKVIQKSFEGLIGEKKVIAKNLEKAMNQLDDERRKVEYLLNEKQTLRESELRLVREVNLLQNHAAERSAFILRLEKSYKAMAGRSIELSSEFGQCKFKLEQVKAERDEIRDCLDKEKQNGENLKERVENMGKKLEQSVKVAPEAKAESDTVSVEKMNLKGQRELLKREIDSLKKSLVEAQNESTDPKSELGVNKLKDAATFCSNGEIDTCEHINGEEMMPTVMDFELIKNAFKCKEAKIDSTKKQLECLQNSVTEADKKKSFWTVLSSATTLLAAVSLAYAARRRSFW